MRYLASHPFAVASPSGKSEVAFDRLCRAVLGEHAGGIALVSSFGAEAIVLLHMVSRIEPALPVLLNETGMLFPETLEYQREVSALIGLTNVQLVRPSEADLAAGDPDGTLHRRDADACCRIRKMLPLKCALQPFSAWITGRKRYQSNARAQLQFLEHDEEGRVKFSPLADWLQQDIARYMEEHELPRHPLVERGFPSIGCAPCTSPVRADEDARAGRWRGSEKTECGIHFTDGKVVRGAA
ncbi:MAG: phosphoadenylyl-sulfate reductase [Alphaproteobacteria bacterium]|nr:phosphoadenylyl-sulfate reductase [Alphaproteobacteria bacterium]